MAVRADRSSITLLAVVGLVLPWTNLFAQGPSGGLSRHFRSAGHIGVGWVANIPTSYLGLSVLGLTPGVLGGAGLYADVKLTTGSPGDRPDFIASYTPEQAELTFGDRLLDERGDWVTVDLALVYAVTPELAVYGGAGYSEGTHYRQYYDASETRGDFGFYWVADPDRTGSRANLLGGVVMRVAPFAAVQAGGQTAPRGVTVGVILTIGR